MIQIKEEFVGCDKWRRAVALGGSDAIVLWLAMKRHAAANLTDGFVADADIGTLPGAPKRWRHALKALHECGETNRDGTRDHGLVDKVEHGWELVGDMTQNPKRYTFKNTERVPSGVLCSYCRTELMLGYTHGGDGFTWDHVIPRCQGGTDDPGNLVPACRFCNSRKCGRTPEQAGLLQ